MYIVMAGVDVRKNKGFQTSFELNAVDLTEDEARIEADRRNAIEKRAGNLGVTWYPCPDMPTLLAQKAVRT